VKQISVIGSASLKVGAPLVYSLGQLIKRSRYSLVTGGMGGVMSAVCEGFHSVEGSGVTVAILPGTNPAVANPYTDIVIPSGLDLGRNALVVSAGVAVIAYGGGAGTLSELAIASQLGRPMLLLHGGGGWVDRLELDEYLDDRCSVPLTHAYTIAEVALWIEQLDSLAPVYGAINSGHLEK